MDREQEEMQFLGVFGIYKEAYKIIFTWRKIFSQVTVALILPLSFIFLAHREVSDLLQRQIIRDDFELVHTRAGTPQHNNISRVISSEWLYFWLLQVAYIIVYLVLSLLSNSAVVYTIASIYTGKKVTFRKVMSVVPKVWKRLMVTFLCTLFAFLVYNLLLFVVILLWFLLFATTTMGKPIFYAILILYMVGLFYLSVLWVLANVVSVLEESCGFSAMIKSQRLIKGKKWVALAVFFILNVKLFAVKAIFSSMVVHGWSFGTGARVLFGIICFVLLLKAMLLQLVLQTVFYFVCKSYHHESIDKSALSSHLEVYLLGEYVPLKSKDVQLEHLDDV